MDGSRTGCTAPSKDNVTETLGYFEKGKYVAPNGKVFPKNSSTARTAKALLDAQPAMSVVKEVVGYSPKAMEKGYPESELSNWFIDILMEKVEAIAGRKVDVGVGNFGGIRIDMPQGDVTLDDLMSMFPFKNQLVYVVHKGSTIRTILDQMAATRFQVLGGVRVVAENGKIVSAEIDGKPIEDDREYGVATNSFLLHGGDGLELAKDAVSLDLYDVDIIDVVLDHVKAEAAAGRPIASEVDGRIIIR
jgi:2',3'-cyclic-nucleotide 2'-phosphodiesterase (5'-nucleotidase family)